ncbi:WXG100 family type VII secretion target [Streptomyces sp. NPDC127068]|uniref:WXG100 family type VII secretion target n=1 Tax=Streptomyces sp. NPDC127068 TaxID=3347127 RepID=UPI00364C6130
MPSAAGDDRITVRLADLQRLAGELEDIIGKLNERLDELHDRVVPVVLSWDGEAREVPHRQQLRGGGRGHRPLAGRAALVQARSCGVGEDTLVRAGDRVHLG